jgi:hypothetical protein
LIFQHFEGDPKKLWITLLKTWSGCAGSLENQAFQQIAHPMCKIKNPIKSMTCEVGDIPDLLLRSKQEVLTPRFTFVHKSSV